MYNAWQEKDVDDSFLRRLVEIGEPVEERSQLVDKAIEIAANKRIVLLGEASHGTADYYDIRTEITKALIEKHNFNFIAVEGDWPECFAMTKYIKLLDQFIDLTETIKSFNRWPTWMWANKQTLPLFKWLYEYNLHRDLSARVGFYGLDLYSFTESITNLITLINQYDPSLYKHAKRVHQCFQSHGNTAHDYAKAVALDNYGCSKEINDLITSIESSENINRLAKDEQLNLYLNAMVIANAEKYYANMSRPSNISWNIRDQHMTRALCKILDTFGHDSKAIVWAHNTHVGDAKYTDMNDAGTVNIGELVRAIYGQENVSIIGFATNDGSVIAARKWGDTPQVMIAPAARANSWENCIHRIFNHRDVFMRFASQLDLQDPLYPRRGQRAIGVIYHPEYEMMGNYVPTQLTMRYDALIYLDTTCALQPLGVKADDRLADTFPSAL